MLRGLVLGAWLVGLVAAVSRCLYDEPLENVQSHAYQLEYPASDPYWTQADPDVKSNYHSQFTLFGRMDESGAGESTITATYYKNDSSIITSVKVVCGPDGGTWETFSPDLEDEKKAVGWQSGTLAEGCKSGSLFDLILKVNQPHLMSWIYKGQALQTGVRHLTEPRLNGKIRDRKTGLKVPSPQGGGTGGAADGHHFEMAATNIARFDRVAFGRCVPWPRGMDCPATKLWLSRRSKGPDDLATFGAVGFPYQPSCWQIVENTDSPLFHMLQCAIHADEFSLLPDSYCCCTNMRTGLPATGDVEKDCESMRATLGQKSCLSAYDHAVVEEERKKLIEQGKLVKQPEHEEASITV